MNTPPWIVGGATVRGSSHLRTGQPNQDAIADWCGADQTLPAIVAVADGHGGARHFRSEQGARFAVDAAVRTLRELAEHIDALGDDERAQFAAVEIAPKIVEQWRAQVLQHLAAHPIVDTEWRALLANEGEAAVDSVRIDPLLAYGATLLSALVTPSGVVLAQLGDGDILAVAPDGSTTRPVPADERLVGNTTTSLCQPNAESDFRVVVLPAARAPLAMLMLSTDGYANSFKTDADFLQVGRDLLAMVVSDGFGKVVKQLPGFLEHASQNGSGDDISLGLLYRPASAGAGAAAGATIADPATPTGEATPAPRDGAGLGDATTPARTDVSILRSELGREQARSRGLSRLVAALVIAGLALAGWLYRDRLFSGAAGSTAVEAPARHPSPAATTGGQGGEPPIKAGGVRHGKPDDAPPTSQEPLPEAGPSAGGGMGTGDAPHLIQDVRAEPNEGGVIALVSVRSASVQKRACDLEATAIGPAGKSLGASSAKLALEPMTAAEHRLQIDLRGTARKLRAAVGSVSVTLHCGDMPAETVRVPLPGAARSV